MVLAKKIADTPRPMADTLSLFTPCIPFAAKTTRDIISEIKSMYITEDILLTLGSFQSLFCTLDHQSLPR